MCVAGAVAQPICTRAQEAAQEIARAIQPVLQQPSYSWTSLSESAPGTLTWRQGPTEGQTEKDGATFVTFTMEDNTISMAFQGDKSAIKWSDQWKAASELSGEYAWIAERLMTYKRAAEEALFLSEHAQGLKRDADGVYNGQLDRTALRFLLSRGRQVFDDPKDMKGTVKFWTKEGRLETYAYRIEGPISLQPDQPKSPIDRTTTVTFKQLGETHVTIPQEALEKLK